MTNLDSLFAPMNAITEPEKKVIAEFNPSAKNSASGVYRAVVKFLPWHENPDKSVMRKTQCFVVDPITQKGRYIDSLRNVGKQCPVVNMFWNIYNTNNKQLQDFAKKFLGNGETYTSLVQIISDDQHPELVGKIVPWRFKKTIWEKLYNEQHPQVGMAHNPFDIINGRYFSVYVVLKNGWNNYDNCQFFDYIGENGEPSSMMMLNPATNTYQHITAQTDRQSVYDYLVANSPNLGAYDHREWSPEDVQYVNGVLQTITNYVQNGGNVAQAAPATTFNMPTPEVNTPAVNEVAMPSGMPNMNTSPTPSTTPMTAPNMNMPTPGLNMNSSVTPPPVVPSMPSITGIDLPEISNTPTAPTMPKINQSNAQGNMNLSEVYNLL